MSFHSGTAAGLFVLVASVGALAGGAGAETYKIDAVHSSVGFSLRHVVGRTSGRFTNFSGSVQYDPSRPEQSRVEATVQATSVNTDNERRDGHLRSADFLNVAQFPTITFVSTRARLDGDRILVTGNLTLHGVTNEVVLPVEVLGVGQRPSPDQRGPATAGFQAELVIKRSDYGVNTFVDAAGVLGDEVKVSLAVEAVAEP